MLRTTNTSTWPRESSIPKWSLRLGYSSATLYRYYAQGRLKGRKLLNGRVIVSKEALCECLNIQHEPKDSIAELNREHRITNARG